MLDRFFTSVAGRTALFAGQPKAFIGAAALIVLWVLSGPVFGYSDTWQLVVNTATTIVTFLMVFLIQNSQNRDSAALQAGLDELLRAVDGARPEFIGIEHLSETRIEAIRAALEREAGPDGHTSPEETVDRLLQRT